MVLVVDAVDPPTSAEAQLQAQAPGPSRFRTRRVHGTPLDVDLQINPLTKGIIDERTRERILALGVIKRYMHTFDMARRGVPRRAGWGTVRAVHKVTVQLSVSRYRVKAHQLSEEEFIALGKGAAFWEQADPDLHLREAWEKRMAMRKHVAVVKQLNKYSELFGGADVDKQSYFALMIAFYKLLINPFDAYDARQCCEQDWQNDCAGDSAAVRMSRRAFMDAVFQLADQWTVGVSVDEYVKFLRLSLDAITANGGRSLRPLDEVGHVGYGEMMSRPTEAEMRAARQARHKEDMKRLRKLFAKPTIPVHMTSKPLLVSRDHLYRPGRKSPRLGAWNGVAVLAPLPPGTPRVHADAGLEMTRAGLFDATYTCPSPHAFRASRMHDAPIAWSPRPVTAASMVFQRSHVRATPSW